MANGENKHTLKVEMVMVCGGGGTLIVSGGYI